MSKKLFSGCLAALAMMLSVAPMAKADIPIDPGQVKVNQPHISIVTQPKYYRLQLKSNQQYLDAKYCSSELGLNPGPGYQDGLCQLWRLVPNGDGWYRLQLKSNQQYLDAKYCSSELGLNPGPGYKDGLCQLWRLVPNGDGWYRLQLKSNQQYLDAKYCSSELSLNPGPGYKDGLCQLWRLVPEN
jgi:hypothetical protein